ncbi:site-2 protease family protein [Candidatus Altiarchaeota archaeon]
MDASYIIILGFISGWILLYRSKTERYFNTFYILRSSAGIRVIDRLSKILPGLWKFMADFSVLLSFGGLGGYYLSLRDETRKNMQKGILLLGIIIFPVFIAIGVSQSILIAFILTVIAIIFLSARMRSPTMDFALTTFFIAFIVMALSGQTILSLLVGMFGLPSLLIYGLVTHAMTILYGETNLPGVSPLVPTAREGKVGVFFPGYDIFIPWWHALVAIIITLVSHEASHGVLTRVCNVKLKSTGLLTLGALPIGAFVEPDEEELEKRSDIDRMRVYTMGSFANLVVGLTLAVFLMGSMAVLAGYVQSEGVRIVGFVEDYPAQDYLVKDSIIYSINGISSTDISGFYNATSDLLANEEVTLNTSAGVFSFILGENRDAPGKGYMGVYIQEDFILKGSLGFMSLESISFFLTMIEWIIFFNINIALVNLLPILPFDGGRMFKEVVLTFNLTEVNVKRVLYSIIVFTAVVFMVNTLPLFMMIGDYVFSVIGLA